MNINRKYSKGIAILLALNLIGSVICLDYAWALRRMASVEDRELEQELIVEGIDINRSLRLLKEAGREVEAIINNSGVLVYIDKLEKWSRREKSGETDLEEGREYLRGLGELMSNIHALLRGLKRRYSDVRIIFFGRDGTTLKQENMVYDLYDEWGKIISLCSLHAINSEKKLKRGDPIDVLLNDMQYVASFILHSLNAYMRLLEDIKFYKNIDPDYVNSLNESNGEPEDTSRFLVFHKQYSQRVAMRRMQVIEKAVVKGEQLSIVTLTKELMISKKEGFFSLINFIIADVYFNIERDIIQRAADPKKFNPELSFAVLDEKGTPIGIAIMVQSEYRFKGHKEGSAVFLSKFAVVPKFQGTHVAIWLLRKALTHAGDRGYTYAHWGTDIVDEVNSAKIGSDRAIPFYGKIGAEFLEEKSPREGAEIPNVRSFKYGISLVSGLSTIEALRGAEEVNMNGYQQEVIEGVRLQWGVVGWNTKDILRGDVRAADYYILPEIFYKEGVNFADVEFLLYCHLFRLKNKAKLIGTKEQIERIRKILSEVQSPSLSEDSIDMLDISDELKSVLKLYRDEIFNLNKARQPKIERYKLEDFAEFIEFDGETGVVMLESQKGKEITLKRTAPDRFIISSDSEQREVTAAYNKPNIAYKKVPQPGMYRDKSNRPLFGVMSLGTSTGFDVDEESTNFIVFAGEDIILVDPANETAGYLERLGMPLSDVNYVYLTHNHADHSRGLIPILEKGGKTLLASSAVYESFLKMSSALVGQDFRDYCDFKFISVNPDKETVLSLANGEKAILKSRWNPHTIPANGIKIYYKDKVFAYAGDIFFNMEFLDSLRGRIPEKYIEQITDFFKDVDYGLHETGQSPLHTELEDLQEMSKRDDTIIELVHIPTGSVPADSLFKKNKQFAPITLIPSGKEPKETHKAVESAI